jgi:methyl-accepting chemotaxis protein
MGCFLAGAGVMWLVARGRKTIRIQGAIGKSLIVGGQIQSFTSRIETNTETAIGKFVNLIRLLNESIQTTTNVVDAIKDKMSLATKKDSGRKDQKGQEDQKDLKIIKERYQLMLNEVMEQLNLTTQRKTEDIAKLDHIKEGVNQLRPFSNDISTIAYSTRILSLNATIEAARAGVNGNCFGVVADEVRRLAEKSNDSAVKIEAELNRIIDFIETATLDLKTAMEVESRFINSTVILLQDVVLSVVDSFVRLSEAIDNTLGDSSRFRDEVNAIIFNLQFEDICKQMSQHTIQILSSIQEDLQAISLGGRDNGDAGDETEILKKVRGLFTMKEEVQIAEKALNAQISSSAPAKDENETCPVDADDVLFFDDPEPNPKQKPAEDDVVFFDETESDDVVFFDEPEQDSGQKPDDANVVFFDEGESDRTPDSDEAVSKEIRS